MRLIPNRHAIGKASIMANPANPKSGLIIKLRPGIIKRFVLHALDHLSKRDGTLLRRMLSDNSSESGHREKPDDKVEQGGVELPSSTLACDALPVELLPHNDFLVPIAEQSPSPSDIQQKRETLLRHIFRSVPMQIQAEHELSFRSQRH